MNQEDIIKEIVKVLPIKNSQTFNCTPNGGKPNVDFYGNPVNGHCTHEATGWNSARFTILEHFKKLNI
jgi:hypothetical protein